MKPIEQFCEKFGVTFVVPPTHVLRAINKELFLFTPAQAAVLDARQPVIGGGIILGELVKNEFRPTALFIDLFLRETKQSITVDDKVAWLYLCGRDIIDASGIEPTAYRDTLVLVKNKQHEILGFGLVCDPARKFGVVVKNLYDKGSLLRREMTK